MELKNNYIKLQFNSLPENVSLARVVVANLVAQRDVTMSDLEEIKVAVSEAVSNAIIHGYQNKENELVTLEVKLSGDLLEIIIEDSGIGISDVEKAMVPTFTTESERMGLGFAFMKSFMEKVIVISEVDKGTKVTLQKKLSASGSCIMTAN